LISAIIRIGALIFKFINNKCLKYTDKSV